MAYKLMTVAFVLLNLSLPALVQGAGTQFITGPCKSDADCADGCCGFNTGLCAGPIVAQQRDGGCGFGNTTPNDNAAKALGFTGPVGGGHTGTAAAATATAVVASAAAASPAATASAAAGNGAGNKAGKQFITGPCTSDADCANGCCGFNTGKCAGAIVAQEIDGGCGFGNAQPNDNAAKALTGAKNKRFLVKELVQ